MKCTVCGAEQPIGMAYCDQCGSPLDAGDAAAVPTSGVSAPVETPPAVEIVPDAPTAPPIAAAAPAVADDAQGTRLTDATGDMSAASVPPPPLPTGQLSLIFPNGGNFLCQTATVNIGRADVAQDWHPELDLIPFGGGIPEMGVSRHHARITVQDDHYLLLDVGSTNGTYVNGTALQYNAPAELKDGDTVAFGAFNARVAIVRR